MDRGELRASLSRVAANHRWTWRPATRAVLDQLGDPALHPWARIDDLSDEQLDALAADQAWTARVSREVASLDAYLADGPGRAPAVAYLSPEFGLTELVPQYSGGLGVLAGDHLKAASDAALPLVGVGLFYRQGYFRQAIVDGGQVEQYEPCEPAQIGAVDTGAIVEVPLAARTVRTRVWRIDIGRVPLVVLDTDVDGNEPADRAITDRLYGGDRRHRLHQEMVLGVGGLLALDALGWDPPVVHLNEGHAAFSVLVLVDRAIEAGAASLGAAVQAARRRMLFTTHTPVPAGIDRFERPLVAPYLTPWAERWAVDTRDVLDLGVDPAPASVELNMAALALRTAGAANAVSALHGQVSRSLFADVRPAPPIVHVTNGVHARTWVEPSMQDLFDRHLGEGWANGDADAWAGVDTIDDDTLRTARGRARGPLAELLAAHGHPLDPAALVVGFARRFAAYKRATLLLRQRDRLVELLRATDRPIHLVFAGKAHPADGDGKGLLADLVAFAAGDGAGGLTFVPDFDMAVARALYAGSDVWLNHPVRPREASGTSGEKAALNGALNCSIRDGWWDEMSDGRNGWDIPTSDAPDPDQRDDDEAAAVVELLGGIADEYHGDGIGPSAAWLARVRDAWRSLGPRITAARMVDDYQRSLYRPLLDSSPPHRPR